MKQISLIVAMLLFSLPGKNMEGASLQTSPGTGYVEVTIDQPASQFTKAFVIGETPISLTSVFTSVDQFWLTDSVGIGSFHTLDLDPVPTLVAIHAGEVFENGTQEFGYGYYYGATLVNDWETLPIVDSNSLPVPEPSCLLLGLGLLGLVRRK